MPMPPPPLPRPSPFGHGFTLIECAVALSVLALVAAMALPSLQALMARRLVEARVSALAGDLRWARGSAIARGEAVRLSLGRSCYVVHTGSIGACRCDADEPAQCRGDAAVLKHERWPAGRGVVLDANVASIGFHPGLGTANAGSLTVSGPAGLAVKVIVSVMGRVRACAAADGINAYPRC